MSHHEPARSELVPKTHWIWFAGAVAWWIDAALAVHGGNRGHALLALAVSVIFFIAGMVWLKTPPRRR